MDKLKSFQEFLNEGLNESKDFKKYNKHQDLKDFIQKNKIKNCLMVKMTIRRKVKTNS